MKKQLIRMIALLMALLCAVTLFGCAEEEEDSIRRKKKSSPKEGTEDVLDTDNEEELPEDQAVGIYRPEETEKNRDEKEEVAVTSEPRTEAVQDQLPDPGTIRLPAAELVNYDYDTLCTLNWFTLQTEKLDDRWILTTELFSGATFTFVFEDLNSKPIVLTVEDLSGESDVYVTYDIQLGDTASELPNEVRNAIGAMDGGLYASATVNGHSADFMLDGSMDDVDNAVVFLMQIRREG